MRAALGTTGWRDWELLAASDAGTTIGALPAGEDETWILVWYRIGPSRWLFRDSLHPVDDHC